MNPPQDRPCPGAIGPGKVQDGGIGAVIPQGLAQHLELEADAGLVEVPSHQANQ